MKYYYCKRCVQLQKNNLDKNIFSGIRPAVRLHLREEHMIKKKKTSMMGRGELK